MKFIVPLRQSYPMRDRNKPKVNPFPSFQKILQKNRNKEKKLCQSNQSNIFAEDSSNSTCHQTSHEDNSHEVKVISTSQMQTESFETDYYEQIREIKQNWIKPQLSLFQRIIAQSDINYDFVIY